MISNKRDFLAGFDYFAGPLRFAAASRKPSTRDARVVQWAWAWPDLAPHVARLLYDAENHVRCDLGGDLNAFSEATCCIMDETSREWSAVSALLSLSPPLTAFEAAIVYHAVIRPRGPPLKVTFSRGNGTFVINGAVQQSAPELQVERSLPGDFPRDFHRGIRVKRWILLQRRASVLRNESGNEQPDSNSTCSGPSDSADGETISSMKRVTPYSCAVCGATFKTAIDRDCHRQCMPTCRPPTGMAEGVHVERIDSQQRDVTAVSFRVQDRHLMEDGNPIVGAPIRVCWDGVPIFVMFASEWMWCREEIAAIVNSVPFHRCYRAAELPFVVFHQESVGVPQLSACFDDLWSLSDVSSGCWNKGILLTLGNCSECSSICCVPHRSQPLWLARTLAATMCICISHC